VLISFVTICSLQQPIRESFKQLKSSKFWIIPIIYFVWLVSSYFWDISGGYSVKDLERYAIILFIPPAMAWLPKMPEDWIRKACMVFTFVTTVVCGICLIKSFIEYQQTHDIRVFYYHYLGEQMGLNAIFLSNYCLASIS